MSLPYFAQDADHLRLEWLNGSVMSILLDAEKTSGRLTVLRSTTLGGSASPVHVHTHEDEVVVLLHGSGVFWAGEHRYELTDGGVAFLPRNVPHAYRFTCEAVDMLAVCNPSGAEEFFRAAGWDLSSPKPEGWTLSPDDLAAAAKATGQTILGPPLAAAAEAIPATYLNGHGG